MAEDKSGPRVAADGAFVFPQCWGDFKSHKGRFRLKEKEGKKDQKFEISVCKL